MTGSIPVKLMSLHIPAQYSNHKSNIWASNCQVDKLSNQFAISTWILKGIIEILIKLNNMIHQRINQSRTRHTRFGQLISEILPLRQRDALWRASDLYPKKVTKMTEILLMKMSAQILFENSNTV